MSKTEPVVTLKETASYYLDSIPITKKEAVSLAVSNFVRWCGQTINPASLTAPKIETYAKGFSGSVDAAEKIKAVREFLNYLARQGFTPANLSGALIVRKTKPKASVRKTAAVNPRKTVEAVAITAEQKSAMEAEVVLLKDKRIGVIEDIKRAAADKDLKENAPYHAAREEKAKLDGKIAELEMILKHAVVAREKIGGAGKKRVDIGRRVTVSNLASGQVHVFKLVIAREVDPKNGCISPASPIGKAIMGCCVGDKVEVVAPACTNKYSIDAIE